MDHNHNRLKAGDLNRKVIIKSPSSTQDSYGGTPVTYTELATVWASVDYNPGGSEQYTADKEVSVSRVKIKIRHRTDITPRMIIEYDSKVFDIIKVTEIGMKAGLELLIELRQ